MIKARFGKLMLIIGGVFLVGLVALAFLAPVVWASNGDQDIRHLREFEMAEDGTRFVSDEAPVINGGPFDGLPDYGADFIAQGYLYPKGTLDDNTPGVNADGSPQFPDLVIGQWTCWGYHIAEGAATESGPVVVTSQLFSFGEEYGNQTIVSVGYELALNETDIPLERAITGGTGRFSNARGEMVQTLTGLNGIDDGLPFGVKLHYKLKLR